VKERLEGRIAVVTGASSGIGRAIALGLAAAGADVVVNYHRSAAEAEKVVAEIARGGRRARGVQADVSRAPDVARLVQTTREAFGRIDIWVNNAGADILTGEAAKLPEETKWDQVMAVDLKGTWLGSRAAGELMREQGGGAIINMSWDHVSQGQPYASAAIYAAAKGGVAAMSRCLAREFAPHVRVNVVAPGWIRTAWGEQASPAVQEKVVAGTPLGRWGTPEDVAESVVFLASDAAAFITGATLIVGGGVVMS
jgi:3-oxoacyl-[acyl-carrier protein] reductase